MVCALIVYSSLTGNTEACCDIVAEELENQGVEVTTFHAYDAMPEDYLSFDICVLGSYAYGDHGVVPDEFEEFYEEMGQLNLSGKIYGVFGSGDTFYPTFCGQVDDFQARFDQTQATRGAEGVKVNLYPEEEDAERLVQFARQLVETYQSTAS